MAQQKGKRLSDWLIQGPSRISGGRGNPSHRAFVDGLNLNTSAGDKDHHGGEKSVGQWRRKFDEVVCHSCWTNHPTYYVPVDILFIHASFLLMSNSDLQSSFLLNG